jgi:hypothetical protein
MPMEGQMDSTVFWIKVQIVGYLFAPLCAVAVAELVNCLVTMLAGTPEQRRTFREDSGGRAAMETRR